MNSAKFKHRLAALLLLVVFSGSAWQVFHRQQRSARSDIIEIQLGHWLLHTGMREAFDAAIEGYQKLHPEVHITQIPVPVRSYAAWSRTQLVGGTAPYLTGMLTLN